MNPAPNETSGIQLPPPVVEQAPVSNAATEAPQSQPEIAPAGPESGGSQLTAQPPALPTVPLPQLPMMPTAAPQSDVSTTTQTSGLSVADDGDLIEKEWVNKAKAIVERNRDDPYKQTEELTVFRADYMQKRYNKTIKLNK